MSIYINPDGTLPLNEAGQPMVIGRDQYRSQCCCLCPCYDWDRLLSEGSCCGLLSSYSVNAGEWTTLAGARYRLTGGPITVYTNERRPCRWYGEGGKIELFSNRDGWGDFFYSPAGAQITGPFSSQGRCFWSLNFGATEIGGLVVFRFPFNFTVGDERPIAQPIGTYSANYDGGTATVS